MISASKEHHGSDDHRHQNEPSGNGRRDAATSAVFGWLAPDCDVAQLPPVAFWGFPAARCAGAGILGERDRGGSAARHSPLLRSALV
jgi:hypothetical protein